MATEGILLLFAIGVGIVAPIVLGLLVYGGVVLVERFRRPEGYIEV